MKKAFLIFSILIAIMLISAVGYLFSKKKNYSQTLILPGLVSESKVVFDDFGIPHIYAENDQDAFRALGYVQASDRLFQMELLRRVGSGQLSEVFGKDLLETDKFIRTIGLEENAKRAETAFKENVNAAMKKNIQAFLDGINYYQEHGTTPVEFDLLGIPKRPFEVIDLYRILGYMGFGFSMELQNEPLFTFIQSTYGPEYLQDLGLGQFDTDTKIPKQVKNDTLLISQISTHIYKVLNSLPVPIFYGSNSWVISGSKSKSGKVLFANDTHIGFSQPSVWYEAHLETPNLKLYGNFLAGIPFPIIGHTMHHAWGLTIFPNDAMDLYSEIIEDNQVLYKNEWQNLSYRDEIISVKDEGEFQFQVTSTPHGPIISELEKFDNRFENPVAMYWVSNVVTDQKLEALWKLSTTNQFKDLEKASRLIDAPGLNIMYGDMEGNIGWIGAAKLIKRPSHVNSKIVLDGASGNDDPLGFYDFSNNPRNINPTSGFVYSANNAPETDSTISIPGYYYAGTRAYLIAQAISEKDDWDMESMKSLVMDDHNPFYTENVEVIAEVISPETDIQKKALSTIMNWDGKHGLEELGPTIYYKLMYHILQKSWGDEMGLEQFEQFLSTPVYLHAIRPYLRNDSSVWWNDIHTEIEETRSDIFNLAFNQSIEELQAQFGNDVKEWKWGKAHFIEHPHPLGKVKPLNRIFNVGPFPISGGEEVINKMAFTLNSSGIYTARSGPAMRILLDFDDIENSLSINPTGQSGYFGDPHYNDQSSAYNTGLFRKQQMNRNEIDQKNIGNWILYPQ